MSSAQSFTPATTVQLYREITKYVIFTTLAAPQVVARVASNPTPLNTEETLTAWAIIKSLADIGEKEMLVDLEDPAQLTEVCTSLSVESLQRAYPNAENRVKLLIEMIRVAKENLGPSPVMCQDEESAMPYFQRMANIMEITGMAGVHENKVENTNHMVVYLRKLIKKVLSSDDKEATLKSIWTTTANVGEDDIENHFNLTLLILTLIIGAPMFYTNMRSNSEFAELAVDQIESLHHDNPGMTMNTDLANLYSIASEFANESDDDESDDDESDESDGDES